MALTFPFSAIVGQDEMKLAILIAAVDASIGGVLVFGDRGTGKSTAVRALAALLPKMRAVSGCRYGCDPSNLESLCEECKTLRAQDPKGALKTQLIPVPVVDLARSRPLPMDWPGCRRRPAGRGPRRLGRRGLMPLLAPHCQVLAADLPGHGFTAMPGAGATSSQLSLPGMAQALRALMQTMDAVPDLVVGHSAGAAIAVRMCLDGLIDPKAVVSLNGAFLPLGGLAGQFFSPVAKLMASAPFVPRLFAWHASDPAVLQRLLASTGSALDPTGQALYGQLVRNPGHAAGALAMMANWDLPSLARDLPHLQTPLCLAIGSNDRTIPPAQAQRVLALLPPHPQIVVTELAGLGHLAHEERPDLIAQLVMRVGRDAGAMARAP